MPVLPQSDPQSRLEHRSTPALLINRPTPTHRRRGRCPPADGAVPVFNMRSAKMNITAHQVREQNKHDFTRKHNVYKPDTHTVSRRSTRRTCHTGGEAAKAEKVRTQHGRLTAQNCHNSHPAKVARSLPWLGTHGTVARNHGPTRESPVVRLPLQQHLFLRCTAVCRIHSILDRNQTCAARATTTAVT